MFGNQSFQCSVLPLSSRCEGRRKNEDKIRGIKFTGLSYDFDLFNFDTGRVEIRGCGKATTKQRMV